MDPVTVLLDHVPVELVHCETSDFPPGVGSEPDPPSHTNYSEPAKVLEELGLVDLANTEATDGYESASDPLGGIEE